MIAKSDAASIFRDTRGSRSIEISAPGAFTAVGFSGQQKKPGASAAERGRPSLFKTIDEDRRQRHDHINRSDRSTYPARISVLTNAATPHHKLRKLQLVDPTDSKKLAQAAKTGRISYRETLLGGCMKRGSCTFGGIDNVIHCGGGDTGTPCADALYDRTKASRIVKLADLISAKLRDAPDSSPLSESLEAQHRSVQNALSHISS